MNINNKINIDIMETTTTKTENKMVKMFNELKAKHPDAVILFRVGDFYESYFDDAKKVSEVLGITLTKRSGEDGYYLAGFPHHALDTYLPKLIRAGLRVAICDDISEPVKLKKRGSNETTQEPQVKDADAEEIKDEEQPQEPQTDEQPTETKSTKIIYTDKEAEDYTPKNGKTFALTEMQEIIGGYVEPIRLNDGRMIIVDEDGKSKDKAVNIPATNILRRDHFTTDYIVGTAIVCDADMVD